MSRTRKRATGKKPSADPNHKGFRRFIRHELKKGHYDDLPEAPRIKSIEPESKEWSDR